LDTSPEARLRELGIEIPEPAPSVANYIGAVRVGELLFVSGHGPYQDGEYVYLGKLGRELDVAAGQASARIAMLNFLATVREVLGSLDRVERIVKLLVMVNSDPDFGDQPLVANGLPTCWSRSSARNEGSTDAPPSGWSRCRWGSRSRSRESCRSPSTSHPETLQPPYSSAASGSRLARGSPSVIESVYPLVLVSSTAKVFDLRAAEPEGST
jgi:enamine deaminase RidA (YjgF/YER057c/UK114 family)